jgi:hypothetical protein
MLIVEGPDGGGKSTLIKTLSERWGLEVAPRVVSKNTDAMVDLKRWVEGNVSTAPHNLIFDRHRLISEPIYGPILRDVQEPGFSDPDWMAWAMDAFYRSNPLIIYCLPRKEVVFENILNDEDNRAVWTHIRKIYTAYSARAAMDMALNKRCTIVYDYTSDKPSIFDGWDPIITHRKRTL